ncbi:MAG: hypothetical protein RIQ52_296 [Pseudomonadota bacterium]
METNGLKSRYKTYLRLLRYSRDYWTSLVFAALGALVYGSISPLFARMIQPIIDGSFLQNDINILKTAPLYLLGLSVIRGVSGFVSDYYSGKVGRGVVNNLRGECFTHMMRLPITFYDQSSPGHLLNKLMSNTEQVAQSVSGGFILLLREGFTVLGLMTLMAYLNWQLSLIFLALGPILMFFVSRVSRKVRKVSKRMMESNGNILKIAQEGLDAIRIIKAYNGIDTESLKFRKETDDNLQRQMKMIATVSLGGSVVHTLYILGFSSILYILSFEEIRSTITPGSLISFIAAMAMMLSPVKRLGGVFPNIDRAVVAAETVFELLDHETEKDDGSAILSPVIERIQLRNITLSYPTTGRKALDGVDLEILPGKMTALVGTSGSGKTSLARLLPRLYDPSSGDILINGLPVCNYTLHSLREQIAYVGQEVTMFHDTVAQNIAYGHRERYSDEQIIDAARRAHALDFINLLPDRFETLIGHQGLKLSGGQRQRLAIARAILKNAPILILDEATSALDNETEFQLQAALEELMQGKTTLVIAHRLSTIERADIIHVMQHGKIIESGTHDDLRSRDTVYATLQNLSN